jgi:hypothetical protein
MKINAKKYLPDFCSRVLFRCFPAHVAIVIGGPDWYRFVGASYIE